MVSNFTSTSRLIPAKSILTPNALLHHLFHVLVDACLENGVILAATSVSKTGLAAKINYREGFPCYRLASFIISISKFSILKKR